MEDIEMKDKTIAYNENEEYEININRDEEQK